MPLEFYQDIKGFILSMIPMTNDGLHIYMGMSCYLATCLLLRRPLSWVPALVPGIALSLLMETVDIAHGSHWTWSLKDILNTNFWPGVMVYMSGKINAQ
jgi:hypothetical protein